MKLDGKAVTHRAFGKGTITGVADGIVAVEFKKQGEKRFFYPGAFAEFLRFGDQKLQDQVEETLHREKREAEESLEAARREQERLDQLRNFKVTPNSQAVFACALNNAQEVVERWQVSTGTYLSGASKGCPRVPGRLKPNSACLLTVCPDGDESKRVIIGAYMVREDFFGDYCTDGLIAAHESYRLSLPTAEQRPFWDFFPAEQRLERWGSTEFKYLANTEVQAILSALCKEVQDPQRKEAAEGLYGYFCKMNHLTAH